MTGGRSEEIVEAVKLLHALCKSADFIAKQLNITPKMVRDIITTGRVLQRQQTLFDDAGTNNGRRN